MQRPLETKFLGQLWYNFCQACYGLLELYTSYQAEGIKPLKGLICDKMLLN